MTLTECTKKTRMKTAFRKAHFNEIRELEGKTFKWLVLVECVKEISNLQEYQGH